MDADYFVNKRDVWDLNPAFKKYSVLGIRQDVETHKIIKEKYKVFYIECKILVVVIGYAP